MLHWFRRRSGRRVPPWWGPVYAGGRAVPATDLVSNPPVVALIGGPDTPTGGVLIGPFTAELLTVAPDAPVPRATSEGVFLPEVRYLAVRYLEINGEPAYTTTTGTGFDGRLVIHYHFPDGYHTTSEDSAVDRLRLMLADLVRERGHR